MDSKKVWVLALFKKINTTKYEKTYFVKWDENCSAPPHTPEYRNISILYTQLYEDREDKST